MLEKRPNLYFDLNPSPPGARHRGTRRVNSVLHDRVDPDKGKGQPDARLGPAWRALLEERSDRLVFGSDVNTGR